MFVTNSHKLYLRICRINTSIFEFLPYLECTYTWTSTVTINTVHNMLWTTNVGLILHLHDSARLGYHQAEHRKGKIEVTSVCVDNWCLKSAHMLQCRPVIVT